MLRALGRRVPEVFRLAIDAFATRALRVDDLVEGTVTIQQGAHESTGFPIDILDTALAEDLLLMLAGVTGALGEQKRTAKALGTVATGVLERVGGVHAQACPAVRGPIGVAWDSLMAVTVEGNSGNAPPMGHRFVDGPVIEGGISRHMDGEAVKGQDGAQVERTKIRSHRLR